MSDTGTTAPGQLPLADRSPCEGELFSVQLLYLLQTREFRFRHARRLDEAAGRARRQVRDAACELRRRAGLDLPAEAADPGRPGRQRSTLADLTDGEVRAQLRDGELRLLRALGQRTLALARFEDLFLHRALPLPREL